jgi:small-conductance mechanosensitive channel
VILSIKDFMPNLVSGLILHQKRNIRPGEKIIVNNIEGEVINVTIIETKLRTKNGEIVYIPNSILMNNVVVKKK